MKKVTIAVLTVVTLCLLCACSKSGATEQNTSKTEEKTSTQQQTPAAPNEQVSSVKTSEEIVEEMFGYRYTVPTKYGSESKSSGALFGMDSCDLFIYGTDNVEFSSWDEAVEQFKKDLSTSIFTATRFFALEQTATADAPFINRHGVEMMRVTGELSGETETKPYIAYYYVTDENYTRFMIVLNYEKESDAAKVIDYVAERLEKA